MNLTIAYTVHSAMASRVDREVNVDGVKVTALVPALVLEMTTDDDEHGHVWRIAPISNDDLAEALAKFTPGTKVSVPLIPGDPAPVPVVGASDAEQPTSDPDPAPAADDADADPGAPGGEPETPAEPEAPTAAA